jgi:hypothetical protein
MHGQFPPKAYGELVDSEPSRRCLKFGDMKGETESAIVEPQEQAVSRKCFKNDVSKLTGNGSCVNNVKKLLTTELHDALSWQSVSA